MMQSWNFDLTLAVHHTVIKGLIGIWLIDYHGMHISLQGKILYTSITYNFFYKHVHVARAYEINALLKIFFN